MNMIPTRKVGSGALAGAVTAVIIAISKDAFGYEFSGELASAVTVLVTFAVSYFVKDAPDA